MSRPFRLLQDASPSTCFSSQISQRPASPSTTSPTSTSCSLLRDQLVASRSVLCGPSGPLSAAASQPSPAQPPRGRRPPPSSPVPVVDVGAVRALLYDPPRVPLPPLSHGGLGGRCEKAAPPRPPFSRALPREGRGSRPPRSVLPAARLEARPSRRREEGGGVPS